MTCPQCSAELSDSATLCPRCGSSLRQMAFSYLPVGTPAWPTTIPAGPVYGTLTAAHPLQQGADVAAAKAVAKPRRSVRSIFVMVALCILVPIVGVGATLGTLWANGQFPTTSTHARVNVPAPTQQTPGAASSPTAAGNQLPTPTSFQTTSIPELGVSLKYPSDWTEEAPQTTTDSTTLAIHPQQRIGIDFFIERFSSGSSSKINSAGDVNDSNLKGFANAQGVVNFHAITPSPAQRTIGGDQWQEQDAVFSNTNGVPFHLTTVAVQHNHLYYDIVFYSPTVYYDEAMQKYFQPMFDSFQFQS